MLKKCDHVFGAAAAAAAAAAVHDDFDLPLNRQDQRHILPSTSSELLCLCGGNQSERLAAELEE